MSDMKSHVWQSAATNDLVWEAFQRSCPVKMGPFMSIFCLF